MLKLIQWPANNRLPGLDLLRLMIMHPHAAEHYAKSHQTSQNDDVFSILFSYLLEDISNTPVGNIFLIWRFFANAFRNYQSREVVTSLSNELLELVPLYSANENKNVRLAVATTLFNFCILSDKDNLDSLKQQCAPIILNMLSSEIDKEVMTRLLVALGTTAYNSPATKSLISLDSLPNVKKEDGQIFEIVSELKKCLEDQK